MSNTLDKVMIILDVLLAAYFFNFAINTTDMTTRLVACVAVTMEIGFIIRHVRMIKLYPDKKIKK